MAPPKQPWFRFYVEACTDKKLRRLTPAQRWLWVAVMSMAKQSAKAPWLMLTDSMPMTLLDLADEAGMKQRDVADGMDAIVALGLVEVDTQLKAWRLPAWQRRQYQSDDTTKRTRKHRSNTNDGTPKERPMERSRNGDGTDQKTETETETERTPPNPPSKSLELALPDVSPMATDGALQVFQAWVTASGKTGRTVLTAERRRLILKQLKQYPLDDVLDAVRGWRWSSHHRGENDRGTVYNDLELVLRDAKHVEMFRDLERNPPAKPLPRGMQGIADWLQRAEAS